MPLRHQYYIYFPPKNSWNKNRVCTTNYCSKLKMVCLYLDLIITRCINVFKIPCYTPQRCIIMSEIKMMIKKYFLVNTIDKIHYIKMCGMQLKQYSRVNLQHWLSIWERVIEDQWTQLSLKILENEEQVKLQVRRRKELVTTLMKIQRT